MVDGRSIRIWRVIDMTSWKVTSSYVCRRGCLPSHCHKKDEKTFRKLEELVLLLFDIKFLLWFAFCGCVWHLRLVCHLITGLPFAAGLPFVVIPNYFPHIDPCETNATISPMNSGFKTIETTTRLHMPPASLCISALPPSSGCRVEHGLASFCPYHSFLPRYKSSS
jgi:hypothetical protein